MIDRWLGFFALAATLATNVGARAFADEIPIVTPKPRAEGPCDRLLSHLDRMVIVEGRGDQPLPDEIGPACRAAIVADPTLEASRRLVALALGPVRLGGEVGAVALCRLHPPWAVEPMIRGIAMDVDVSGRSVCLAALSALDDPAARHAVDAYLHDSGLHDNSFDEALVDAAAQSEPLRAQAGSLLVAAWASHAHGFSRLAEVVCRVPVPDVARQTCEDAVPNQESRWQEAPERRRAWIETGAYILLGGALAVGGTLARNNDAGRAFAVTAATLGSAKIFALPLEDQGGGANAAAMADGFRPVFWVVGGAVGLTTGLLFTQEPGASRTVTSIVGATFFTLLSVKTAWKF